MIEDYGVDPYRRSIAVGEPIAFQNNREDRVVLRFDRSSNRIVMEPGDTTVLRVTGTTYASLEASNGWRSQAQIYVE